MYIFLLLLISIIFPFGGLVSFTPKTSTGHGDNSVLSVLTSSGTKLYGVNISAAEFTPNKLPGQMGIDYIYPNSFSNLNYFHSKKLTLIRYPILWERVQHAAYGTLSEPDMLQIESFLQSAHMANLQVIIELHNYGNYYNKPLSAKDSSKLADVWHKLAARLKTYPGLYGYELMNEPHDMPDGKEGWIKIAQYSADAIRSADQVHTILIPGYGWQSAKEWQTNNDKLLIHDPMNNLIYSAHEYFDADSSGTYRNSYDSDHAYATIGVDRSMPFITWLLRNHQKGMFTEYGIPNTDERWNVVLNTFLASTYNNSVITGGTYWSSGPWWGNYPLSVNPLDIKNSPQLLVIQKYPSHNF